MAEQLGLSQSKVSRAWQAFGWVPHERDSWKPSKDPQPPAPLRLALPEHPDWSQPPTRYQPANARPRRLQQRDPTIHLAVGDAVAWRSEPARCDDGGRVGLCPTRPQRITSGATNPTRQDDQQQESQSNETADLAGIPAHWPGVRDCPEHRHHRRHERCRPSKGLGERVVISRCRRLGRRGGCERRRCHAVRARRGRRCPPVVIGTAPGPKELAGLRL